jgi:hypothetical protein
MAHPVVLPRWVTHISLVEWIGVLSDEPVAAFVVVVPSTIHEVASWVRRKRRQRWAILAIGNHTELVTDTLRGALGSVFRRCSARGLILGGEYCPGPGIAFERRVRGLLRARGVYHEASAMLSTLGGGHFLCRHERQARALANRQLALSMSVGDTCQAVRCAVHHVYLDMSMGDVRGACQSLLRAAQFARRLGLIQAGLLRELQTECRERLLPLARRSAHLSGGEGTASGSGLQEHPLGDIVMRGFSSRVSDTQREQLASGPASLISPAVEEVHGMLRSAAVYVFNTGKWLAGGQRTESPEDYSRQLPGSRPWNPLAVDPK